MAKLPQKIHFVGIGGIGMSALAKLMHIQGATVSGSDLLFSEVIESLEGLGIEVTEGHDADNLPEETQLLVYSSAIGETNPERKEAAERGIKQRSYFEFLGDISKNYKTIVVTGTHGKSTTTAMLGTILVQAGFDPTVIVGTIVPGFEHGNLRVGQSPYLVVEGCEYRANMLNLRPDMIVLTNIEEDHLDYYRDLDHIRATFQKFIKKLGESNLVIWDKNDPESAKLEIPNGLNHRELGRMTLQIPGAHNETNARSAMTAAMALGVSFEPCRVALEKFPGVWRRFETVGYYNESQVISDYGHHPTEISATIKAIRAAYPGKRLVHCFQPHQHARTKALFKGFVTSLQNADHLILTEVYDVAGRDEDQSINSADLFGALKEAKPDISIEYAKTLEDVELLCRQYAGEETLILIQGAGDIDDVARNLFKEKVEEEVIEEEQELEKEEEIEK